MLTSAETSIAKPSLPAFPPTLSLNLSFRLWWRGWMDSCPRASIGPLVAASAISDHPALNEGAKSRRDVSIETQPASHYGYNSTYGVSVSVQGARDAADLPQAASPLRWCIADALPATTRTQAGFDFMTPGRLAHQVITATCLV
jgi:hypothetical protein